MYKTVELNLNFQANKMLKKYLEFHFKIYFYLNLRKEGELFIKTFPI